MANSARANLPLLATNQRSKELTHNEALTMLEGITVGAVAAMNVSTPPGNPAEGLTVVVGANPTGVFVGHTNAIAHFYNNSWKFYNPQPGWFTRSIQDNFAAYAFNGTNWVLAAAGGDATLLEGQPGSYYRDRANHEGVQTASTIADFAEVVDDRVAALLQQGTGIAIVYDDTANTLTISSNVIANPGSGSFDVNSILTDKSTGQILLDDNGNVLTYP